MAAIFDLRHTQTPNNIIISDVVFYGTENVLCRRNCVAIMSISWDTCNYIILAAILDFWLPVSSGSVTDSTNEKFDPENMGVAVGILFLASLEAEISLGVVLLPLQHKRHRNNLQRMRVNNVS